MVPEVDELANELASGASTPRSGAGSPEGTEGADGAPSPSERERTGTPDSERDARLAEREKRPGVPDECVPVMCALVGYEHADAAQRGVQPLFPPLELRRAGVPLR